MPSSSPGNSNRVNGGNGISASQVAFMQELDTFRQHWQRSVEAHLGENAELMKQFTSIRSVPEFVQVWQNSASKHASMMSEGGKLLSDDYQRCMTAAAKCLFGGFTPSASS